jgi:hypothetical protein
MGKTATTPAPKRPKQPLTPPAGKPGWTATQIGQFVGVDKATVYRWCLGVEINGHPLKLATVVDEARPQLGRFVTAKEWARFWAAYKLARASSRPRKGAATQPLAGAA